MPERLGDRVRRWERRCRPDDPEFAAAPALRREHGVRSFLAHNMTVTLAIVCDERRWRSGCRSSDTGADAVWEIERGAGTRLDFTVFENGGVRCNRTAYGFVLDGDDPRDLAARDTTFRHFAGIGFAATPAPLLAVKLLRLVARHPRVLGTTLGWARRSLRRVGVWPLLRHGARPLTFVMHRFMDAADVAPAWSLMQQGVTADDPRLHATQERLAACHYAMAHPETGTLVPACVQHSVLDPAENARLAVELPMPGFRGSRVRR